jgi:tetratricopeptide (TPR) repeat protein
VLLGFFAITGEGYGQSAQELSNTAYRYYQQGNFKEAIPFLEKSIKLEPTAKTYFALGLCYMQLGSLDKAHVAFQNAVALDPAYVSSYHLLAERYLDTGSDQYNIDKAMKLFEKALKIDPNLVRSQYSLSQIYFIKGTIGVDSSLEEMKRYQKLAEQALLRTVELDPKIADAHLLLGQLYGTWGQRNSAILEFQKVVKLNPQHFEAWLYLGMDYYGLGLFAESAKALEKAQQSQKEHIRKAATELLQKARAAQSGKK